MGDAVNITQAKAHFSRLLKRVQAGEDIVIAKAGKPIAVLSAVPVPRKQRVPGMDKGKVIIRDDFDDPMPEFEKHF